MEFEQGNRRSSSSELEDPREAAARALRAVLHGHRAARAAHLAQGRRPPALGVCGESRFATPACGSSSRRRSSATTPTSSTGSASSARSKTALTSATSVARRAFGARRGDRVRQAPPEDVRKRHGQEGRTRGAAEHSLPPPPGAADDAQNESYDVTFDDSEMLADQPPLSLDFGAPESPAKVAQRPEPPGTPAPRPSLPSVPGAVAPGLPRQPGPLRTRPTDAGVWAARGATWPMGPLCSSCSVLPCRHRGPGCSRCSRAPAWPRRSAPPPADG